MLDKDPQKSITSEVAPLNSSTHTEVASDSENRTSSCSTSIINKQAHDKIYNIFHDHQYAKDSSIETSASYLDRQNNLLPCAIFEDEVLQEPPSKFDDQAYATDSSTDTAESSWSDCETRLCTVSSTEENPHQRNYVNVGDHQSDFFVGTAGTSFTNENISLSTNSITRDLIATQGTVDNPEVLTRGPSVNAVVNPCDTKETVRSSPIQDDNCFPSLEPSTDLVEHHTPSKENLDVCPHCCEKYETFLDLKKHVCPKFVPDEPHLCHHCGKKFGTTGHLDRHMLTHTGEKPYVCSQCDAKFRQSAHLKTHMLTHTGEKSHMCPYCGKTFKQSAHLTTHIVTHIGKQSYVCPQCNEEFECSSDLKKHVRSHPKIKHYDWSPSGKYVFSPSVPETDLRSQRKAAYSQTQRKPCELEQPFPCPECCEAFINFKDLEKHMYSHGRKTPCICLFCRKFFSDYEEKVRHNCPNGDKKPFSCPQCQKGFNDIQNLRPPLNKK